MIKMGMLDWIDEFDGETFGWAAIFYIFGLLLIWKMPGFTSINDEVMKSFTMGKIIASVIGYPLCVLLVHWSKNR